LPLLLTNSGIFGIFGAGVDRDDLMPLMRDRIIGHDLERLAFRFTTLNDGEVVQCRHVGHSDSEPRADQQPDERRAL